VLAVCLVLLTAACSTTRLDLFVDIGQRPVDPPAVDPPAPDSPAVAPQCNPCADFPPEPILDTENGSSVPSNVGDLFAPEGSAASGVGPCLIEPELGSVFPKNWLRPRFRFIPAAGQNLFEIRLRANRQLNDLVVYTSSTTWTLPVTIWAAITSSLVEEPIAVSIRGLDPSQVEPLPSLATTGTLTISASEAKGSIVYWSTVYFTNTGESTLKGFSVGDESVREILRPEQTNGECVACHTSTPDGRFVATAVSSTITSGDPSHVELRATDGSGLQPDFISSDALLLLAREQQQLPTFSKMHWRASDRLMVTILNQDLIWTDLEAATQTQDIGWGILARDGDPNILATHPAFNAAGTALAYTTAGSGALTKADATDVYILPFNDRKGGSVVPLAGASTPEANEYYPAFSPDDALVAFSKAPLAQNAPEPSPGAFISKTTYNNPLGEIFVVSHTGGSPQRLLANDPPTCSGKQSPGVTNSWGKWSPEAEIVNGKTYYWLTFSSTRVDPLRPQLYVTPIIVDASGQLSTYPALYLWNQPPDEGNHTPAWGL